MRVRTLVVIALTLIGARAMAIEKLGYTLLERHGDIEIREYAPFRVAAVDVAAEFDEAGSVGFRSLFKYIGGANTPGEKIAMTSPVLQQSVDATASTVMFVMPAEQGDSPPAPSDPAVRVETRDGGLYAALRYSGSWTVKRYEAHLDKLMTQIAPAGYRPIGPPLWARYNPPFVPPFMRHNEVLVPVAPASEASTPGGSE